MPFAVRYTSGMSLFLIHPLISSAALLARRMPRMLWLGALLAWLATSPCAAQALAPQEAGSGSPSLFARTVVYVQGTSAEEQADFAAAALTELAAVYMAEADLARSQVAASNNATRVRLRGWSVAVDQYAGQLLRVLDDVEEGFPVSLRASQRGPATITVAGRAVMLGHPRPDQQAAYEQRVLSDFCSFHDCAPSTISNAKDSPIPATATGVNPQWNFTERGSICTHEGLEVHFDTVGNLALLRSICKQLAQESAALAGDLAWQVRHGVSIDWDQLAISATPGKPEHLVRLNSSGDSVLLTVPLLYASTNLLADIRPWLFARATGAEPTSVRLAAADYGWR